MEKLRDRDILTLGEFTPDTLAFFLQRVAVQKRSSMASAAAYPPLAGKALGFAQEAGGESGVPIDLASLVQQTFLRAREEYGGSAWSPMVVKLLEDAVGTELRAPGFPPQITA